MSKRLKPWYKVVTPRADLREGKPLDAAEFAVHLDKVRDGSAPKDYQEPQRFFEKTFLTKTLLELAAQVVRRLNGVKTETSAVFNLATQFGGGKTHALTLLYHLGEQGSKAHDWTDVRRILMVSGQQGIPTARTAVFVGTEFDSLSGRGGNDGTPARKTPWGEIAWQLGGQQAFDLVAEHDREGVSPGGDVLNRVIPDDEPCLILMDELMNYISRNRRSGLSIQFYNFLQNLTETVRGKDSAVIAVSVPASELELNEKDTDDYNRITKLLDRLGKAMLMSADTETAEIIRRRLFEWDLSAVSPGGKALLDRDAENTCSAYADWCVRHRQQIAGWFAVDEARQQFRDTYPFHPSVLTVFERKWRGIPKFQQTRGILRLLSLWVSLAYKKGFEGAHKDALITQGTAPLDDSTFRSACFEQLGERRLETAVTTDIAGDAHAHSMRLDKEATDEIKKARLHRKVATSIFFESNGGQLQGKNATTPELRLSVGDPQMDIGNVETTLDALVAACYYLTVERAEYRFSMRENLNKRYADRRATIRSDAVDARVRKGVQTVFGKNRTGITPVFFPEKSIQVSDRPALTFIVADFTLGIDDGDKSATEKFIDRMIRESGSSGRTFKSAQLWIVADSPGALREEARRLLAWEDIQADASQLHYDGGQITQLRENIDRAKNDLQESIWRSYKYIYLMGKENKLKQVDMGLVTSSQTGGGPVDITISRLRADGEVEKDIGPNFLVRNWPPASREWSTKNLRDAFFSSPQFPRLLDPEAIKETIIRGVSQGVLAYVGKRADGHYEPFLFEEAVSPMDVEISEDMYIITKETAEEFRNKVEAEKQEYTKPTEETGENRIAEPVLPPSSPSSPEDGKPVTGGEPITLALEDLLHKLSWTGEINPQKWMIFYTKVLSKYVNDKNLKVKVSFETSPEAGITNERMEETKNALRELGLDPEELKGD